jgi:hypothetical protein
MFNDYEWLWTFLLCLGLLYTAYIIGYAIHLGGL